MSPGTQTGTVAGTVTESGSDGDHKARVAASEYELKGLAPGDCRETFTLDDNSSEFVSLKPNIPSSMSLEATCRPRTAGLKRFGDKFQLHFAIK